MTDKHISLFRLERTQGEGILTLEDLADPQRYVLTSLAGFEEIKSGDWYQWHDERRFCIARTAEKLEDTWTVQEYAANREKCYVFDVVTPSNPATPEVLPELVPCKNWDYIKTYTPPREDDSTLIQHKLQRREVNLWSQISLNAIFLTKGFYYQKESINQAKRCDTNQLIPLRDLNLTIGIQPKYESTATRSANTLIHRNTLWQKFRAWQNFALGGVVSAAVLTGTYFMGTYFMFHPEKKEESSSSQTPAIISAGSTDNALENCLTREKNSNDKKREYELKADSTKAELITCKDDKEKAERRIDSLSTEHAATIQTHNNQYQVLQKQYGSCTNALNSASTHGTQIQSQLDTTTSQLQASTTQLQTCVADAQTLVITQAEVDDKMGIEKSINSTLRSQNDQLLSNLNTVRENLHACEQKVQAASQTAQTGANERIAELERQIQETRHTVGLCQNPQNRYTFIREKMKENDFSAVNTLVTQWIRNTCGQNASRCVARDRFVVEANSPREAGMALYKSIVGDRDWHDGENDRATANTFVEKYLKAANIFAPTLDLNAPLPGTYGF